MPLPQKVTIYEVGPRDGLQNEPEIIPTAMKIEWINALAKTGLCAIETTSFVSPRWVPQMADHTEVMQGITQQAHVRYPVLVPNEKGLAAAIAAGAKEIAVFTAASETFSQKNTNCNIATSLQRISTITQIAAQHKLRVRGYISCVLGCPYEGTVAATSVAAIAQQLLQMGVAEISLGDTIGVGTPQQAQQLIHTVAEVVPLKQLAIHFHDTYGQALANIYACLELGIQTIDSSAGGLGGCPYAPGAGGNVATEDVIYMLNGLGIESGVDLTALMTASTMMLRHMDRSTRSKVAQALHQAGKKR